MRPKRHANSAAWNTIRKMNGARMLPSIAMLEVMPAVMGTSVSQNRASPMPPRGDAAEIRTERMVCVSNLFCSRERTMPMTNVTRKGCVLMKSRLWYMDAARSFLLVWTFSRPGTIANSQPPDCIVS